MKFTPSKLNAFLFFKLPSAFISGVRVYEVSPKAAIIKVKHRWINQNPFNSMYFAVQAMAAELSTGILVMLHINNSGKKVSMLVTGNRSTFTKKAKGKITFTCNEGDLVQKALGNAVSTGQGQTFTLTSTGVDEQGDIVSVMEFEWSIKLK